MCGRFTLLADAELIAEQFELPQVPELAPRYNIAPTQPVAAVRLKPGNGTRELTHLHWGLIPFWSKDPKIGNRMINARSETVAEKPAFRAAFKYRRCLVPISGFYEWQKVDGGKQPYYIHHVDNHPLAVAGLWEHWQDPNGSEIESCTLLTTRPNDLMEPLHNRMPVLVAEEDYDEWLDPGDGRLDMLHHLLRPYDGIDLKATPVSTIVNNPRNDVPECIVPI